MSTPDFGVPIDQRHFEDYVVGSTYEYGTAAVDEREAVAFARAFDPQPIHVDPVAAAHGPFGGLIASGWHTVALMMRLFVDNYLSSVASLASPGVDELRWLKPVRPGDVLSVGVEVVGKIPSRGRKDMGVVRQQVTLYNQHDEPVQRFVALAMIRTRPTG
jgi:acyl dehydratase